jgi:hypothetical protein
MESLAVYRSIRPHRITVVFDGSGAPAGFAEGRGS